VLVRSEAYQEVGPYFDKRFFVIDLEVWLRLALSFPVGYIPMWDSFYRFHPGHRSASVDWGGQWLLFQQHAETLIDKHLPEVQFTPRERRERRASAHLSIGLDRLRDGQPRHATRAARTAISTYPPAALDLRVPAILLAAVLGSRARSLVQRLRYGVNKRDIRLPFRARH
jgi:hypothetical protein